MADKTKTKEHWAQEGKDENGLPLKRMLSTEERAERDRLMRGAEAERWNKGWAKMRNEHNACVCKACRPDLPESTGFTHEDVSNDFLPGGAMLKRIIALWNGKQDTKVPQ